MREFFNYDRGFWKVLGRVGDFMILNLLFFVTALPIITIGAAQTALHSQTIKMVRKEEGYIARAYFKSFKTNFVQSTIMWVLYVAAVAFFLFDLYICGYMDNENIMVLSKAFALFSLILVSMIINYSLALQAVFINKVRGTLINGLVFALGHFIPFSIIILVVQFFPIIVMEIEPRFVALLIPYMMFFGFAVAAYINSKIYNRIFKKYMPEVEEESEEIEEDYLSEE